MLEPRLLLAASVSEYPFRTTGGGSDYVTLGPDKDIWVTLGTNNVGQLNTSTGVLNQYAIPTPDSAPSEIITGPDGNLWFIETASNQFGVVNPKTGSITEVPVLADGASQIQDLAAGPDGNIWFTEYKTNRIGEINPTSHAVQEFAIPTANSEPYGIVKGPDNNLWFTESGSNKVGMINPTTHTIVDFAIPSSGNDQAEGITVGPDRNLWFAEAGANAIGTINPTTDAFKVYTAGLTSKAGLSEITSGPDGRLWFTEPNVNQVGVITTTGVVTERGTGFGSNSAPAGIVAGNDGNLYCGIPSAQFVDGIGKVTTGGTVSSIYVPSTFAGAGSSIVSGNDGNLWFVQSTTAGGDSAEIGEINPTTHLTIDYPLNGGQYSANKIALDPANGTLWTTVTQYVVGSFGQTLSVIFEINPTTRVVSNPIQVPTSNAGAFGLTYDPADGDFWFAEQGGNTLGSLDPATGAIADNFLTLPANSDPTKIVADASGNLWFTENGTGMVGVYNLTSQTVTQVSVGANSNPYGIALGPDNNIWFTENGEIGVINPNTEKLVKLTAAPVTGSITAGPDNALWFTEGSGIGRIDDSSYAITSVAATNATPASVTTGPDGNIWFTGTGTSTGDGTDYPNVTGVVTLTPATTPTQLGVTTEPPPDVTASKGFGLVVSVENASGGVDVDYSGTVTIALGANPGGSTLGGTLTATALNGVATFPGLNLNLAGSGETIVASATGLTSATSTPITVSLAATHLVVTTQPPASFRVATTITVTVAAEDDSGNIDTSFDGTLTAALGNNPGASTLAGTLALGATSGVASFTDLALNNPGADYTILLADAASKLRAAQTSGFNVTPPQATHLVVTSQPPSTLTAGASFGLVVSAENNLGQVDFASNAAVSLLLTGVAGATLGGTLTANLVDGVATFAGLSIDQAHAGYNIIAGSGVLTSATTGAINVTNGQATSLTLTPMVGGQAVNGVAFAFTVNPVDSFGNVVMNYTGTVHFTSSDAHAILPVDDTFTTADQGSHAFHVTFATLGGQTLTVTDTANPAITSTASIQVNPPTVTTTSLTITPSGTVAGQSVTLTATVSPNSAGSKVTFLDGSKILGVATLASGVATLTLSTLTAGTHSLSASYAGSADGAYSPSASAASPFLVAMAKTTSSLATSATVAGRGRAVTLSAAIKVVAPGAGAPTGVVKFFDGTTLIGTGSLNAAGTASLTVSTLAKGGHSITATYAGDPNDSGSTTAAVAITIDTSATGDYDGDGKSDLAIYDQTLSEFLIAESGGGSIIRQFGNTSDVNVPLAGDFDGDGKADLAIYDQTLSQFVISESGGGSIIRQFGNAADVNIPIAGDFDGDGKADLAIYDQTASQFIILESGGGTIIRQFGNAADRNVPIAGDFDGDGKADLAIYDQTISQFIVLESGGGSIIRQFGNAADVNVPIAGDFDGDGKADLAIYDQTASQVVVLESGGGTIIKPFGPSGATNIPISGDFDGDGKADLAIYDATDTMFFVIESDGATLTLPFGTKKHANLPI